MGRFPEFTASKTHADLLASCSDALAERHHEINSQVISDLLDAGYTVTLGVYPQKDGRHYAGKPYAHVVNRDVEINFEVVQGTDKDAWDVLADCLRYASERTAERNI